ncbi:Dolichyl-diphosphooligosaccharide--protein glycosyltransferase subunit DAD1 [Dendrobium catenatum]|uniref:Dolichyl-diphosphooligosaccharide--protein glycosyltransferase subunit DAD1 n=1 Tax=Dendrobium catenatum TaxID=906689 RepID=A0A2I0VT05_9ASPA|nr:Dolichyl-diphosphooligosaccharide--protein glycosyltransferase subunit DAD1 [Dendrobium catenatum]
MFGIICEKEALSDAGPEVCDEDSNGASLKSDGVLSSVGTAVLEVCLRIQLTEENKEFKDLPLERAFADFVLCNHVLHLNSSGSPTTVGILHSSSDVLRPSSKNVPLIIKEPLLIPSKPLSLVIGKGKSIMEYQDMKSPRLGAIRNLVDSDLAVEEVPVMQQELNDTSFVCANAQVKSFNEIVQKESEKNVEDMNGKVGANPWNRHKYVKINLDRNESFLMEDGTVAKLHEPNVQTN